MPTEILRLLAFEGPNIVGPQPGVLLQARCGRDRSARLRAGLKDSAQGAGIVIGALEVSAAPLGEGKLLTASFSTPTPALGAAVARYVVEGLNAHEAGDETWDAEGLLWDLQKRRRAETLPLGALQLIAEAQARGMPAFVHQGSRLQLGYGARGRSFELADLGGAAPQAAFATGEVGVAPPFAQSSASALVPWERIGAVPVVAVSGAARGAVVEQLSRALESGVSIAAALDADFDRARELLADPGAQLVLLGLDPADTLRRGLPFDRCVACAVVGWPPEAPDVADRGELARALGLPALVTDPGGLVVLDPTPPIAALSEYAAGRVALLDLEAGLEQLAGRAAGLILEHLRATAP
jgi:hypothetical protein